MRISSVKSKTQGANSNCRLYTAARYLVLSLMLSLLLGCDLKEPIKEHIPLIIEQAWVDPTRLSTNNIITSQNIDDLNFELFKPSQVIPFSHRNKGLLLKIAVPNHLPESSELTLSVFPNYLDQVSYFYQNDPFAISDIQRQLRHSGNRYFSSHKYAFNIDVQSLEKIHYLYLDSDHDQYIHIEMVDTISYIKADSRAVQVFTMAFSIIVALVLFHAISYFFNRKTNHLLYITYLISAMYALLWHEGRIHDNHWFSWPLLGNHTHLFYLGIADIAGNLFFYRLLRLNHKTQVLVKLILICIVFRAVTLLTAMVQYQFLGSFDDYMVDILVHYSMVLSGVLLWIVIFQKALLGSTQAKLLLLIWSLLFGSFIIRLVFMISPHPNNMWMVYAFELTLVICSFALAFVLNYQAAGLTAEEKLTDSKQTAQERTNYKHQLITQFQQEIQDLVQDPTLGVGEVSEKINIKFHLLINRAFPIKNSLLHVDKTIKGICTTGFQAEDLSLLKDKVNIFFNTNQRNNIGQYEITTTQKKTMRLLYLPLNSNEFENTRFIFGLKQNKPIKPRLMSEFKSFCLAAYTALKHAEQIHEVSLAANLDSLTGCHNRNSIVQIIKESLKHARRTTAACFEFATNAETREQHDNQLSDQCILELTDLLKSSLNTRAKIGRMGPHEFIAIFSDVEFETCELLLEQFLSQIKKTSFTNEGLSIDCHIGVAESRLHETGQSLVKKANSAQQQAKENGANKICIFDPSMNL